MSEHVELNNLMKIVDVNPEVIVWTEGKPGKTLLSFLTYTYRLDHITCIAEEKNLFLSPNKFDHDLPVVTIENLITLKDSALIVVAVPDERLETVKSILRHFEFKNIEFFADVEMNQAQEKLQQLAKDGSIMFYKVNKLIAEMQDLKYLVTAQNEIASVNSKAFEEYRNTFRNKKIVIVATGPTLKYYKPIPDAIHIGLNFAWRNENIPLNYLFTLDANINSITELPVESGFDKIKNEIFIGKYFCNDQGNRYSERYSLISDNVIRFFANVPCINGNIYQDICCHPVSDILSVSFSALHFALFTYPKEIYLVGCDTTPSGHFYDKKNSGEKATNSDMLTGILKVGYARMKMFAEQYYPDTKIISVNPVGLKGLFEDIYTDEYKKEMGF